MFEKPKVITTDEDIEHLLSISIHSKPHCYYCYSFSPLFSKMKQEKLVEKFRGKLTEPDQYHNLLENQSVIVRDVIHDLLPLARKRWERCRENP